MIFQKMDKKTNKMKQKTKLEPSNDELVNLDEIGQINKIEVSVDGRPLPLKIGDKLEFPIGNPILKTITAIQINENGIESYLLEWFEDDSFKQYWISMTEIKILKENIKKHQVIGLSQQV